MEIRHLQTFITIVEVNGFTKAADYLGYAQSTITAHIQILEFSSIEAIKKCVINGLRISFLPFYAIENEINEGSLKMIEVEETFSKFRTQLVYHKNKSLSISASKFIETTLKNISNWE